VVILRKPLILFIIIIFQVSEMSEAINGLGETNQSLMESNTGLKDELDTTKVMLEQSKANLETENVSFYEIEQLKSKLISLSEAKSWLENTNQSLVESIEALKKELDMVGRSNFILVNK
jgi:hypothetical protein